MDTIIDFTPKPNYLIVDSANFDKTMAAIKLQHPEWISYCDKQREKHPALNKWKVPMQNSYVNWGGIIAEITCEQVVELDSSWKPVLPEINKN